MATPITAFYVGCLALMFVIDFGLPSLCFFKHKKNGANKRRLSFCQLLLVVFQQLTANLNATRFFRFWYNTL